MFNDTGTIIASGQPLHNFGGEKFGPNTLTQALTHSINTTFAKVGLALGAQRLGAAMTAFGFGRAPSVDLPAGMVVPSGRYSKSHAAAQQSARRGHRPDRHRPGAAAGHAAAECDGRRGHRKSRDRS